MTVSFSGNHRENFFFYMCNAVKGTNEAIFRLGYGEKKNQNLKL